MSYWRISSLVLSLVVLAALPARGSKLMKISGSRYLVSDQATTGLSGTGSMRRKVYRVAASLCTGLEYAWMVPLDQEAGGGTFGNDKASATMEVEFFHSEKEARDKHADAEPVACEGLADAKQSEKLVRKLRKQGDLE